MSSSCAGSLPGPGVAATRPEFQPIQFAPSIGHPGLDALRRCFVQRERHRLSAETRVLGSEMDRSSLLSRANPHRSRASDQREWIVPDDFRGTVEAQCDCIVCVGTNRSKFIRNAEHDASGVGPISTKLRVIGMD